MHNQKHNQHKIVIAMTKYIYLLMTFLLISCSGNKQKTKFIIPTENLVDII